MNTHFFRFAGIISALLSGWLAQGLLAAQPDTVREWKVGDVVVVIGEGTLQSDAGASASVFVGLPLEVLQVRDGQILVSNGVPGWLATDLVLPAEQALLHFDSLLARQPGDTGLLSARANTLAALGRLDEAVAVFSGLIEAHPQTASFLNERAGCYLKLDDLPRALADLDAMIALAPDFQVHYNRGSCKLRMGDQEGARADLQESVRLNPDFAIAWLLLARVQAALRETGGSIEAWERYLALVPGDPDAWFDKGAQLFQADRKEEAVRAFEEAVRLAPGNPDTRKNLGLLYRELGNVEASLQIFRQMVVDFPADSTGHINLGDHFAREGNWAEAERHFSESLRLDPENPYCHFHYGRILAASGKLDQAADAFRKAIELDPKPQGIRTLAELQLQRGMPEEACTVLALALNDDPGQAPDLRFFRARILQSIGRNGEAAADCSLLIDAGMDAPELWYCRALARQGEKQYQSALDDCERGLVSQPDHPRLLRLTAWLLATSPVTNLRDPARAVRLATQLNELQKGASGIALDTLGTAHAAAGEMPRAVELLEQALTKEDVLDQEAAIRKRLESFRAGKPWTDEGT